MDRVLWLILAVAVGSFALNILLVDRMPWAAFYLPMTRFWELMLGGILGYLHLLRPRSADSAKQRNLLAIAGLMLLVGALALVKNGDGFPGWRALLPTIGTVLLIQSGPQAWINRRILANRGVVYIGLISYPLYLWHWPILSFVRIIYGGGSAASSANCGHTC
jgi:peptidoglycan/LPS O-acetylase OafA/YrhL